MADLIDRQVIDTGGLEEEIRCAMCINPMHTDKGCDGGCRYNERLHKKIMQVLERRIKPIPAVQTDHNADISEINKFIDGLEEIFADIRERHIDESVCGLCEYDGAYMGQSGDWCNECPGFDKDDCFKLSDKTRKKWIKEIVNAYPDHTTDMQPEIIRCKDCKYGDWYDSADGNVCCYCIETGLVGRTADDYCSKAERR